MLNIDYKYRLKSFQNPFCFWTKLPVLTVHKFFLNFFRDPENLPSSNYLVIATPSDRDLLENMGMTGSSSQLSNNMPHSVSSSAFNSPTGSTLNLAAQTGRGTHLVSYSIYLLHFTKFLILHRYFPLNFFTQYIICF